MEIITCDPTKYRMDHPNLLYQILWKNPLVYKGLNTDFQIVKPAIC